MTTTQNVQQPIGWLHMEGSRITCFTQNQNEPTLKNEKKVPVYLHPAAQQAVVKESLTDQGAATLPEDVKKLLEDLAAHAPTSFRAPVAFQRLAIRASALLAAAQKGDTECSATNT